MKIKTYGVPYTEGYAENVDPKTGVDKRDVTPGGIESMPVNVAAHKSIN